MKKLVVINFNSAVPDLSDHFDVIAPERLPEMDALVTWNDVVGESRAATDFARRMNIPVFVMQHGWYSVPECEYTERKVKPEPGVKHLLWSENARELFTKAGVAAEDTAVVGCPLYMQRVPKQNKGQIVMYAPVHADDHVEGTVNTGLANDIWKTLCETEGIRPFMKLCRSEHLPAAKDPRFIYTERTDPNHVKQLLKILAQVSVVVTHDEGTFALLAYLMDIPVVKVKSVYPRITDACEEVELAGMVDAVRRALADPSVGREERKRVVENAGGSVDEAEKVTQRVAEEILKVIA